MNKRKYISIVMITSGFIIILEHIIHYGYTWELELKCHGLYGLILIILGFITGAKVWWLKRD